MATDSWVNETLYADWGQRFLVKRELARVQSAFQDIMVFESHSHGRVMLLDGVVQITEADEFVYQEMLTHVPMLTRAAWACSAARAWASGEMRTVRNSLFSIMGTPRSCRWWPSVPR